jgi:hypothetical protein
MNFQAISVSIVTGFGLDSPRWILAEEIHKRSDSEYYTPSSEPLTFCRSVLLTLQCENFATPYSLS